MTMTIWKPCMGALIALTSSSSADSHVRSIGSEEYDDDDDDDDGHDEEYDDDSDDDWEDDKILMKINTKKHFFVSLKIVVIKLGDTNNDGYDVIIKKLSQSVPKQSKQKTT